MNTIKSQPIFDYVKYPNRNCMVRMFDIKEQAYFEQNIRGKINKPVYITKTFCEYIIRSQKAFPQSLYTSIIKENNGNRGMMLLPDCVDLEDNVGDKYSYTAVWACENGVIMCFLFCYFHNKANSHELLVAKGFSKDGYIDVNVLEYLTDDDELSKEVANYCFHYLSAILIYLCLRKYAKVEVKELKHGKQAKINNETYQSQGYTDFEVMDCKWFTEICSDKEFSVRGHFRLQPKKNEQGEWIKELIYINEFKKHGYHRKAGIQKAQENAE